MPLKLKISPALASSQLETHMKRRSRPASRSSPTPDAHMCPVYRFYLLEEHQQMHCSFDGNTHAASASASASASLLLLQDVAHGCNLQTLQAFPRACLKCSGTGHARPDQTRAEHVVHSSTTNRQPECQMLIMCSRFQSRITRILNSPLNS